MLRLGGGVARLSCRCEYREVSNSGLIGVLGLVSVGSTLLNRLLPRLNVIVAILPAEAHLETVWWVSMLQGVLIAGTNPNERTNERTDRRQTDRHIDNLAYVHSLAIGSPA